MLGVKLFRDTTFLFSGVVGINFLEGRMAEAELIPVILYRIRDCTSVIYYFSVLPGIVSRGFLHSSNVMSGKK